MLSFLGNDQRDSEEPGHLKILNALQEDAGNNFSYLVPMNNEKLFAASSIWCVCVGGDNLPPGKSVPIPPTLMYTFIFM